MTSQKAFIAMQYLNVFLYFVFMFFSSGKVIMFFNKFNCPLVPSLFDLANKFRSTPNGRRFNYTKVILDFSNKLLPGRHTYDLVFQSLISYGLNVENEFSYLVLSYINK